MATNPAVPCVSKDRFVKYYAEELKYTLPATTVSVSLDSGGGGRPIEAIQVESDVAADRDGTALAAASSQ